MASAEAEPLRRSRPPIRTFQALLFYITQQWWDFFARLAGVISLRRNAFRVDFSDAADRQRSWEFWGFAWLLIALAERLAFGEGTVGDGMRAEAVAEDFLQRVVLEAVWLLPFYLFLNLYSVTRLTFFEFWLNCGPVVAALMLVERVAELAFWLVLNPALLSTHRAVCPGALSTLPMMQTECLNGLTAMGIDASAAQLAHVGLWTGLMVFGPLVLWRYTTIAQGEPPGRAALRVLAVQAAVWSVAFYFAARGFG